MLRARMSMGMLRMCCSCIHCLGFFFVCMFFAGDGDPPDNSAAAFVALKKPWPADRMAGVRFTVLGLGDSNYTRFMYVPRVIKSR